MTQNQIKYWTLIEEQRANKARENENTRHNTVSENETTRHNVVTEGETNRHNLQTEVTESGKLAETTRHNKATENLSRAQVGLGYQQLTEQKRHNMAGENISNRQISESIRHNKAGENLTGMDVATRRDTLSESIRHNKRQELNSMLNTGVSAINAGTNVANTILGGKRYGKTGTQIKPAQSKQIQNISARNFIFTKG